MTKSDLILKNARLKANKMEEMGFHYSNKSMPKSWKKAKQRKLSNCASFVTWVLQTHDLKILKHGQSFYSGKHGILKTKGAGTKARLLKKMHRINVHGKYASELKHVLKPGDVCQFGCHTAIFHRFDEDGRPTWYDAGKKSTNTHKSGGRYVNIHRRAKNAKIYYIMRAKE